MSKLRYAGRERGLCGRWSDPSSALFLVALLCWCLSVQGHIKFWSGSNSRSGSNSVILLLQWESPKLWISISKIRHGFYSSGLQGCIEFEIEMRPGCRLGSVLPISQVSPWVLVSSLPLYMDLNGVWQEDDLGHSDLKPQVIPKWWDTLKRPGKWEVRLDPWE